jgi:predicted DNA-binding protein
VKEAGHSKAFYVREAVAQYIEDLEDMYIAAKRLQEKDREWTLEELKQGLELVPKLTCKEKVEIFERKIPPK